jgi:hypothetical protein
MRKYLLGSITLLAFFCFAPQSFAAIAFVQSTSTQLSVPNSATSATISFASSVTVGDLLVALVRWTSTSQVVTTTTVSDSKGNVYLPATTVMIDTGENPNDYSQVWYAPNSIAGATAVTATFGSGTLLSSLAIHEYSGIAATSPLDTTSTFINSTPNATTTFTSGVTTTNFPNELLFGGFTTGVAHGSNAGNSYTKREVPATSLYYLTEDRIVSATGTYAATGTINAADDFAAFMVAFSASSTTPVILPTAHILRGVGITRNNPSR